MKKWQRTAGALLVVTLLNAGPALADSQLYLPDAITVDGKLVELDQGPVHQENNLYVPLRFLVEAAGGEVTWDGATQSVSVSLPDRSATFIIGQDEAEMNQRGVMYIQRNMLQMAGPVLLMNGRTMVTPDALFNVLGFAERPDEDLTMDLFSQPPSAPPAGKLIPGEAQVAAVAVEHEAVTAALQEWAGAVAQDEEPSFTVVADGDGVVVGLAGGLQSTGGYTFELLGGGARLVEGVWYLDARLVPPSGMATQAFANPVAFFELPGVSGQVEVNFWLNGATP